MPRLLSIMARPAGSEGIGGEDIWGMVRTGARMKVSKEEFSVE